MAVRFVYFDLGNVLVRFSVHRMLRQLAELTQKTEADLQELLFDEQRYRGYELGETTTEEFLNMIRESLDAKPSDDAIIHAINDIFWPNDPIISIARKLNTFNVPRGILSNTNELHWNYVDVAFPFVSEYFPNHRIASCAVHALKPFPEIDQIALDEARTEVPDLQPGDVLFIDDLEANVVAAKEFGFQTIHYVDFDQFLADYKKTGLPLPSRYLDDAGK